MGGTLVENGERNHEDGSWSVLCFLGADCDICVVAGHYGEAGTVSTAIREDARTDSLEVPRALGSAGVFLTQQTRLVLCHNMKYVS